ncbi:hypothetical protein H6P81_006748 [Aristolochia fimbriata]|uniref:UDP-glucuronate decarboxylase n=1 Tax=Aristolochia fimbriata TaxID=158543 RepID=A0AAV7EZC2_ARIFI|nr:hypothetical protein H6P81_006748 [Aristolochia fimbriata]
MPSQSHPTPFSSRTQKTRPLYRSVNYILKEQRLLFVLVGVLIASTIFLLHPTLMKLAPVETNRLIPQSIGVGVTDHEQLFGNEYSNYASVGGATNRVPKGLRRQPRRIVVTGGAGFVGSHLVDKLIARGDNVIVIDNFFTGRKENVMHHFGNPKFELIRHDVVEPILLEVDQIYHLACPASPVHYKYNPTNVMGTLNMLGLAKRIGARFLLTSTSEVYGDPLEHPQKETYWGNVNPIGVRSCYDEGKRTAETLTMDYHRGAGVEVRIARIFNTYGPRMSIDDGRVVSNFVAQALRKQPLTVYGDGNQTRSFQFVADLVDGLMALMEGEHVGPFNLGNPGEFTMLELAEVVKEVIDSSATIEFKPNTADDPHKRKPDITKAKELLNWEPKVSLKEGLPRMVTDFQKRGYPPLRADGAFPTPAAKPSSSGTTLCFALLPTLSLFRSRRRGDFVSLSPPPPPPTTTSRRRWRNTGSHSPIHLRALRTAAAASSYYLAAVAYRLFLFCPHMCGDKKSADAIPPRPTLTDRRHRARSPPPSAGTSYETATSSSARPPFNPSSGSNKNNYSSSTTGTSSASSHASSLASLRDSLSDNPHVYSFQEIAAATNNFLARRISASSSAAWRCSVRERDVVLVQRRLHRPLPFPELRRRLAILCKSHHSAIAKLLGASISPDHVYLVYEFVKGATLSECLRSPVNPDFTVLGTWISRMQIAEDVAHGLEYIHHSTGLDLFLVHNHIQSSTIVLTDPDLRAKICHFGAADLTGEVADDVPAGEIEEEGAAAASMAMRRSGSRTRRVQGTRGYMAPEIIAGGGASQKSDVYAFGVVLLELLSGAEPVKYRFDPATGDYEKVSQVAMASEAAEEEGGAKLRRWIDRRLRDSFPTDVARKMTRLALECVEEEAGKRPDMGRMKGKISRLYLESKAWSDKMKIPTEFTVSLAGR